jgi:hypothetical protein
VKFSFLVPLATTTTAITATHQTAQVALGRNGLAPAPAASLSAVAGDPAPALSSTTVPYTSLGPASRAALAAACQHELHCLGSSLEDDEQLLAGFRRLAGAGAELAPLRRAAEEAAAAAAEWGRRAAAAAGAAKAAEESAVELQRAGDSEGAAAAVSAATAAAPADADAAAAEAAAQAAAAAAAEASAAAARLAAAEAEIAAIREETAGVKEVAVRYRAIKKRLLQGVLTQL